MGKKKSQKKAIGTAAEPPAKPSDAAEPLAPKKVAAAAAGAVAAAAATAEAVAVAEANRAAELKAAARWEAQHMPAAIPTSATQSEAMQSAADESSPLLRPEVAKAVAVVAEAEAIAEVEVKMEPRKVEQVEVEAEAEGQDELKVESEPEETPEKTESLNTLSASSLGGLAYSSFVWSAAVVIVMRDMVM